MYIVFFVSIAALILPYGIIIANIIIVADIAFKSIPTNYQLQNIFVNYYYLFKKACLP